MLINKDYCCTIVAATQDLLSIPEVAEHYRDPSNLREANELDAALHRIVTVGKHEAIDIREVVAAAKLDRLLKGRGSMTWIILIHGLIPLLPHKLRKLFVTAAFDVSACKCNVSDFA